MENRRKKEPYRLVESNIIAVPVTEFNCDKCVFTGRHSCMLAICFITEHCVENNEYYIIDRRKHVERTSYTIEDEIYEITQRIEAIEQDENNSYFDSCTGSQEWKSSGAESEHSLLVDRKEELERELDKVVTDEINRERAK